MLEATALPTEPQLLPKLDILFIGPSGFGETGHLLVTLHMTFSSNYIPTYLLQLIEPNLIEIRRPRNKVYLVVLACFLTTPIECSHFSTDQNA